ncbi:MAG: ribonuclease E/G [Clostridiales bacterium]|jgi:ribonuclease E|nr:ribonuclease E/G [Clostridiales bacterium]
MKELLLRTRGEEPALAITKDRRLTDYYLLNEDGLAYEAGAIHLGRVRRVMKSLKAVFVVLDGGVEGFLPFDEMPGGQPAQPGDSLLVQIKKPAQGGKAAFLTCDLALPGRTAMLLPLGQYAHASKRVKDKKAMSLLSRRLCPDNMGLVLRAKAQDAKEGDIQTEIDRLVSDWDEIAQQAKQTTAPALIREAPGILERLMRDEQEAFDRVLYDDEKAAKGLPIPGTYHDKPFSLYGIEQQLFEALKRRVYLPSGGLLVLDPCEAMLVIDVNSAKDGKKAGNLSLRTNVEAAKEIARLLRLRRVSGIILIDFIDMDTDAQRQTVVDALEEALKDDRVTSEVLGFTRLGILEMTRKKAELMLKAQRLENNTNEEIEEPHA